MARLPFLVHIGKGLCVLTAQLFSGVGSLPSWHLRKGACLCTSPAILIVTKVLDSPLLYAYTADKLGRVR